MNNELIQILREMQVIQQRVSAIYKADRTYLGTELKQTREILKIIAGLLTVIAIALIIVLII